MIWRDRRPITGKGEYILGTDRRDFYNICIWEPRLLNDHRMILVEIKGYRERRNHNYCKGRTNWPITDQKRVPIREEDAIFDNLQKEVKIQMIPARERVMWI